MKNLMKGLAIQTDWTHLPATVDWVVEQALNIQKIPAPTFHEKARAQYMKAAFAELGLQDISIDAMFNVFGRMPGTTPTAPGVMICAHTDTVFTADTDLTIRRGNGVIHGPGLGDNSIGVGGMLGVAYAFRQLGYTPPCDLWFVATSREEGLGNLDGMRMAFETLQPKLRAVLNVEGLAYGYVYHAGIAVRRLKVTTTAQGGHSWLHFGRASATHALMDVGARINRVRVPAAPRTTYNIGIIEGGHSINSIATEASLWLDLRSESTDELATLEARVMREINAVKTGEIEVAVEIVGDRPAGYLVPTHPLVQGALAALEEHGARGTLQKGSTDGNIPLAAGFPTVTIGVTRGGNAHREDEFIELEPVTKGMRQLVLLTMATATTELANP